MPVSFPVFPIGSVNALRAHPTLQAAHPCMYRGDLRMNERFLSVRGYRFSGIQVGDKFAFQTRNGVFE